MSRLNLSGADIDQLSVRKVRHANEIYSILLDRTYEPEHSP